MTGLSMAGLSRLAMTGLVMGLAMGLALLATRLCRILERIQNAKVGRVGSEVLEPEQGIALAGENVGHPAEGVVEVPEGNTDAGVDLGASADSLGVCVSSAKSRRGPDLG